MCALLRYSAMQEHNYPVGIATCGETVRNGTAYLRPVSYSRRNIAQIGSYAAGLPTRLQAPNGLDGGGVHVRVHADVDHVHTVGIQSFREGFIELFQRVHPVPDAPKALG